MYIYFILDNKICDNGFFVLIDQLTQFCKEISELDLRGNKIYLRMYDPIVAKLKLLKNFTYLDLRGIKSFIIENVIKSDIAVRFKSDLKEIKDLELGDQVVDTLWDDNSLVLALIRNNETNIDQLLQEIGDRIYSQEIVLELSKNDELRSNIINIFNNGNGEDYYPLVLRMCFDNVQKKEEIIAKVQPKDDVYLTLLERINDNYLWDLKSINIL